MITSVVGPLLLAGALACAHVHSEEPSVTAKSIDQVLAAYTDSLMALPGVVGTAIALVDGERCIKVLVSDSGQRSIPSRLEGYRVVVEVTGAIRPR